MRIGCALIAGGRRNDLIERTILPNLLNQGFDEIVVVGMLGSDAVSGVRFLDPPPIWHSTLDALMKRDVAAVATESDVIVYLSDDHRCYTPHFADVLRSSYGDHSW